MRNERSAGAVVYFRKTGRIEFLMMKYRHGRWDFPRGHLEKGETDHQAAVRELQEEIGVRVRRFVPGFREAVSWRYTSGVTGIRMQKEVVHFLVKLEHQQVRLSEEDLDMRWLPYREAMQLPMWPHVKQVLKKANTFILARKTF
ncbi:MAG: NUDIX domain-containing protein [Patescibacteria group bacterium]|jgi:8-oxo-dGTP pyrophosphatase MutT (NUDIX family)